MASQQVLIDSGLVIVAFEVSGRGELQEIPVTLVVLAQQNQMVGTTDVWRTVKTVRGSDIDFAAQDRLQPSLDRRFVELHGPKNVPVVGDGDGGHLELRRAIHQSTDFTGPIEQAVIRVEMKMDKVFWWHPENILTEMAGPWRTHKLPASPRAGHRA